MFGVKVLKDRVDGLKDRVDGLEGRLRRYRYDPNFGFRELRLEDRVASLESKLDCLITHLGLAAITTPATVQPEQTHFHPKEASK